MIRINLLGVERQKRKAFTFDTGRQITLACSAILIAAVLGIGWWYWSLTQQSQQVDADIAAAQQEAARLRSLLTEVQQFEAQRAQLQQRVALIQQLRRGQSIPVQLLDHVSRSLPEMLWLTQMDEAGTNVTIQGMSTTLIAVSDFVSNLGNSALLKKPIEIVNTDVQSAQTGATTPAQGPAAVDVIKFTVKAQLADTATIAPAANAAPARPR